MQFGLQLVRLLFQNSGLILQLLQSRGNQGPLHPRAGAGNDHYQSSVIQGRRMRHHKQEKCRQGRASIDGKADGLPIYGRVRHDDDGGGIRWHTCVMYLANRC